MGRGGMSFQLKTARFTVILINVVIFLIGATLIGEGLDLMINRHFQDFTGVLSMLGNSIASQRRILANELVCVTMLIPGFIFVCIGFCGCSGAITQIQCLLQNYAIAIGTILLFQTIIVISLICFRSKLVEFILSVLNSLLKYQYNGPLAPAASSFSLLADLFMYRFQCCGLGNKDEFLLANDWNRTNPWWDRSIPMTSRYFKYPLTCCPIDEQFNTNRASFDRMISCAINGSDIYQTNCFQRWIDRLSAMQEPALVGFSLLMLAEMIVLTFVLFTYQRSRMTTYDYINEGSPPPYASRTRRNNANLYVQIHT